MIIFGMGKVPMSQWANYRFGKILKMTELIYITYKNYYKMTRKGKCLHRKMTRDVKKQIAEE